MKKIFSNICWLFFDKIFRLGVGLFTTAWIARYLGPEQFGLWNYAIAFVVLFTAFSTLGLDNIVIRSIVREPHKANEILGSAFFLKLIGAIATLVIAAVMVWFVRRQDILIFWLVVITASALLFHAFDVIDFYFQSQVLSKYTVYARNAAFILISIIKVFLVLFSAPLISFAIASLFEIAIGSFFLVLLYNSIKCTPMKWRVKFDTTKRLLMDSWPLILSGLAVMLYMRIDQIMIGGMLGDKDLGIYSAAVRISELWYFIPLAIVSSVFPAIVGLKRDNEQMYYQRLQQLYDVMALVGLTAAIFFTLSSKWIISVLFGQEYLQSANILSLHIWSGVFVCLGVSSTSWLMAENLQKYSFYRAFAGLCLNVVLNFILIPKYGIIGSAIATLIAYGFSGYLFDAMNKITRQTFLMKTKSLILFNSIKKVTHGFSI